MLGIGLQNICVTNDTQTAVIFAVSKIYFRDSYMEGMAQQMQNEVNIVEDKDAGMLKHPIFKRMSKAKWIYALAIWLLAFCIFVFAVYMQEKTKIDAASSQAFEVKISSAASISDILSSSGYPFSWLFILFFVAIFIPLVGIFSLQSKLQEEVHVGWRRIYFLIPAFTTIVSAFKIVSANFLGAGYFVDLLLSSFIATVIGCVISFCIMWIREGFEKK